MLRQRIPGGGGGACDLRGSCPLEFTLFALSPLIAYSSFRRQTTFV